VAFSPTHKIDDIVPDVDDIIGELLSQPKFGDGLGFRRVSRLLQPVWDSDWGRQFKAIKITGSNGKGSVACLVHAILRAFDIDCGRTTSPHLEHFRERIVLTDAEISDAQLQDSSTWLMEQMKRVLAAMPQDRFGSFELITALALRTFQQANVTTAVVEAGIGGRYDPTRFVPGDLVALTSIDLEHTALLGSTKELIACDKLDLCPDGGTVVAFRTDDNDLWTRMTAYCDLRRITLIDAGALWNVTCDGYDLTGETPRMNVQITSQGCSIRAKLRFLGSFQLSNIAIACTLFEFAGRAHDGLRSTLIPSLARLADNVEQFLPRLVRGLEAATWPGRCEQISSSPRVIIDVGHSPDACTCMAATLKLMVTGERILLVTGVSADKSVEAIITALLPVADSVICTRAHHHGSDVEAIATIVDRIAPSLPRKNAATIEDAATLARQIATEEGMTVFVAGGLFLAIEFKTAWAGRDPRQLRFY
jgi:dihydrofolate synthase/folylpolyglutamate synthase